MKNLTARLLAAGVLMCAIGFGTAAHAADEPAKAPAATVVAQVATAPAATTPAAAAPEAAAAQRPSERSTLRGCPSIGHDDAKVHRPAASRSARPQRRGS